MDKNTIQQLNQLNKDFYETVFKYFSDSRGYFWQGWNELLPQIKKSPNNRIKVLDVGCGNGRFAQFLEKSGFAIDYLGIDNSAELLGEARKKLRSEQSNKFNFLVADVLDGFQLEEKFDLIVCFGVLHHIPGFENRKKLLSQLSKQMGKDAILVITAWQFVEDKRLMNRVVRPETLNINGQLEEHDFILDWKRGKHAYRYCHYTSQQEIEQLTASISGLKLVKSFLADGKTHKLNRYFIFRKIR